MSNKVTRRDFMKGAAAGAMGFAAVSLLGGCGQTATPATAAPTATPEPPVIAAPEVSVVENSGVWYDAAYFAKPDPITDIAETVECDVCVVGAGNGGCVAAISAADAGASVVWVEKNAGPITW
ncbi:MAG: FAD-binding protein, partial [Clostridia bacterium]|nr:FAD-binding protein [Clostridia bacterium]